MKTTIHHIGIYTDNPKRLIEFYEHKLGFTHSATKSVGEELMGDVFGISVPCTIDKMKFENVFIEVFSSSSSNFPAQDRKGVRVDHWGMNVKDKDSYVRQIEEKGVPVIKFEGQGKWIFFIRDPDGNLIEIYEDKSLA